MYTTMLEALEHPTPDSIDYNDRKVFASTILWLEDQKIRHYKIEDREGLRQVDRLEVWESAYKKYKEDVGMPTYSAPLEELSWLLSYAVRLEFLDSPEKYTEIDSENVAQKTNKSIAPSIKAQNAFDYMDFNNKDFVNGVHALGSKLKVPQHPNHLMQLEAIARVVHERLSSHAKNRQPVLGTPFPFEKGEDIVSPNDTTLDRAVRILRLLQIQSLRELQTHINETIVVVQNLTANPKTDTKLGKVGR